MSNLSVPADDWFADTTGIQPLRPRPARLVPTWHSFSGIRVTIRPIRSHDSALEQAFLLALCQHPPDTRLKDTPKKLAQQIPVKLASIDYDREMAYVATIRENGSEVQIGVCRYLAIPGGTHCEFALTIAERWQHLGVGTRMMRLLMNFAYTCGMRCMFGDIVGSNHAMISLCKELGFTLIAQTSDPSLMRAVLFLANPQKARLPAPAFAHLTRSIEWPMN